MFHFISMGGLLVFYIWNIILELGRVRGVISLRVGI